jgi:hypothetical protein
MRFSLVRASPSGVLKILIEFACPPQPRRQARGTPRPKTFLVSSQSISKKKKFIHTQLGVDPLFHHLGRVSPAATHIVGARMCTSQPVARPWCDTPGEMQKYPAAHQTVSGQRQLAAAAKQGVSPL